MSLSDCLIARSLLLLLLSSPPLHSPSPPALPYKWRQTLQDVTVTIPVPPGTKGRDLIVTYTKTKLKVGLKGKDPIIDDELCKEIRVDDSTWTLGG